MEFYKITSVNSFNFADVKTKTNGFHLYLITLYNFSPPYTFLRIVANWLKTVKVFILYLNKLILRSI